MNNASNNGKVTVEYIITQMGKNPYTFSHKTEAPAKSVTLKGIASKIGFALADQLLTAANKAMAAKEKYGKYQNSFRPKAAFKVSVLVNQVAFFHAIETKGIDAIRLVDGKGNVYPRTQVVDKFDLIATMVESAQNMTESLSFEADLEAQANAKEALKEVRRIAKEAKDAIKVGAITPEISPALN